MPPPGTFDTMIYALLCYGSEDVAAAGKVDERPAAQSIIGERALAMRLMPTTTAVTVRGRHFSSVLDGPALDGPSTSHREDLLSVHIAEAGSLAQAIDIARQISDGQPGATACEVRPIAHLAGDLPATPK